MGLNLGGLIRAGVAGVGGAMRGANQGNEIAYQREQDRLNRERQQQQDALQAYLLQQNISDRQADNERADAQLRETSRANALREVLAKRQEMLDANKAYSDAHPAPPPLYDPNTDPVILRGRQEKKEGLGVYRPDTSGSGSGGGGKTPPVAAVNAMADNRASIRVIDEALNALDKNPDAVGPSLFNYAPEWVKKPFNTEERAKVQAPIADIASLTVKLRSGATVTLAEEPRLAPFIPDIRDKPDVVKYKLTRLRERLSEMDAELSAAYQGDPNAGQTPPAGIRRPGGKRLTQQQYDSAKQYYSDAEIQQQGYELP